MAFLWNGYSLLTMQRILFILALTSIFIDLPAQSRLSVGLTVGDGKEWYKNEELQEKSQNDIDLLGLSVKYRINNNFYIRSGINHVNKQFEVTEIPLGLEYQVLNKWNIGLILSSGLKVNINRRGYLDGIGSNCWGRDSILYTDISGRDIIHRWHLIIYNGLHIRLLDQLDFGFTLNSGFTDAIITRSERFIINDCSEVQALKANFLDSPDKRYKNSYYSVNLTYWLLRLSDEKKQLLKDYRLSNRNALYSEAIGTSYNLSVNYDRIILTTANENFNTRVALRGGMAVYWNEGSSFIAGLSVLYGKKGHYIEAGIGYALEEENTFLNLGYRYQMGSLFGRAGVYYVIDPIYYDHQKHSGTFYPGLGIGINI